MFVEVNESVEKRWETFGAGDAVFAVLSLMLCFGERAISDPVLWLSSARPSWHRPAADSCVSATKSFCST